MVSQERFVWQERSVVSVRDSAFAARLYREQSDLRSFLTFLSHWQKLRSGCEIGSGYGRMTAVLTEFCECVTGFERESHFVETSRTLVPTANFILVETLNALRSRSAAFDFALTFTVLQHLSETDLQPICSEIVRILAPNGFLLICEETDLAMVPALPGEPQRYCTTGRSVEAYSELFRGLDLVMTRPRRIEPGSWRTNPGTYILFHKPAELTNGAATNHLHKPEDRHPNA